jgi:hypothetical protein
VPALHARASAWHRTSGSTTKRSRTRWPPTTWTEPPTYQIVFLGECREVLADVLGDTAIESRHGYTRVVAAVRDQSEFYGLLDRFADLALWPVSLIELGTEHLVTATDGPHTRPGRQPRHSCCSRTWS